MELYFVRHAQSANNALYAETGSTDGRHSDPPLTDAGHQQARLVARRLAQPLDTPLDYAARLNRRGYGLTHLYCSLMVRAVETGGYIAEATGLPLVAWAEIHERGGVHLLDPQTGIDQGLSGEGRSYYQTHFPALALPETLTDAGWWNRDPEGLEETLPRALAFWEQLLARHGETDDRVAVVSHGGFFQALMTVVAGHGRPDPLPGFERDDLWFSVANTSINRFDIEPGFVAVRYLNDVAHLPPELITG